MGQRGINVAEECHVVNIIPPTASNAAVNSDVWIMRDHANASVIISQASATSASTVTVKRASSFAAASTTAISFHYYAESTDSGDTLGARTSAGTAGFAMSTNSNAMYVLDLPADDLTASCPYFQVSLSAASGLRSAVCILSGSRYGKDQNRTQVA